MNYLAKLGIAVAIGVTAASAALATPIELTLTSGTGPGSSMLVNDGSSMITYANPAFNGWAINLAWGMSRSPALALGALDLTTNTANCIAASCAPLTIAISDIGYMVPVMPNGLMSTVSNSAFGNPSTLTQWGYLDTSNAYFGSNDPNAVADFGGAYDPSTASGIGPITVDGSGSASAYGTNGASSGPYSLTLVDQFCSNPEGSNGTCTGGLSFSSDGGISTPEPGTLALFGAGLLGCALFVGRRRASKVGA